MTPQTSQVIFDWMLPLNIIVCLRFYIQMIDQFSTGPFTFTQMQQATNQRKHRASHWAKKDLLKYAVFLHYVFSQQILSPSSSCRWSLFRSLSMFLQNKNPNQCRMLHLDMLQTHGCIEAILRGFLAKYQDFLSLCRKFAPAIANILHIIIKEKSKSLQATCLAAARPTICILEYAEEPADEKNKEQLKPTDIYYPESAEQAHQVNSDSITSRKRLGKSEKTTINIEKRLGKQFHLEFVEYRQRVIKIGGEYSESS